MKVLKSEFLKMVRESVQNEIKEMLNETNQKSLDEALTDKMVAHWNNAKTAVKNAGHVMANNDDKRKNFVDANVYSQQQNQYRADQKSDKKLQKAQNLVNKRFQSKIAPVLAQYGIDTNNVLQAMNTAIVQNMKNTAKPTIDGARRDATQQTPQAKTNKRKITPTTPVAA